jgi:Glycosyltransferase sugar-binding region containing DXD motif
MRRLRELQPRPTPSSTRQRERLRLSRGTTLLVAVNLLALLVLNLRAYGRQQGVVVASGPSNSSKFPRVLHQTHATRESLTDWQLLLSDSCQHNNPSWEYMFWSDADAEEFIKQRHSDLYTQWKALSPPMKRVDSLRYLLMHTFGGVYIDVDVECVRPLDELAIGIPIGAGATGGYPEPMFLASWPRNAFWLFMLQHAFTVSQANDVWHTTGPAGLNDALVEWGKSRGRDVFVPYGSGARSWFVNASQDFGASPQHPSLDTLFTFLPNELVDPAACNAGTLEHCVHSFCNATWNSSFLVHHCGGLWRGPVMGGS